MITVCTKDWDRMLKLVTSGNDGAGTASVIKDRNKAIARFIAGVKLEGSDIRYNERWNSFSGAFSEFGNKALELGATYEEIIQSFLAAAIPGSVAEKLRVLGDPDKKLKNRFVGDIARAILEKGWDIKFIPANGYAITHEGRDAMSRNGRKWTIGYRAEVKKGDDVLNLVFDAITDEGDGPTSYVLETFGGRVNCWGKHGKRGFIDLLCSAL